MEPKPPASSSAAPWSSALTHIETNRILLRGYPIDELMGRVPFGHAIYLLLTGELPSRALGQVIDAMLVGFIDHGVTPPPTLAARHAATTGATARNAVAAGVIGFGKHYGGDVLACRTLLDTGLDRAGSSLLLNSAAAELAEELVQADNIPPPGFGHRIHTVDPRATRLMQLAHELDVDQLYTQFLRALEQALARHPALTDQRLPINVDGAIAALCGDMGLSPEIADVLLVISRVPGLAAHALEEQQRQKPMRVIDSSTHRYDGPQERRFKDHR